MVSDLVKTITSQLKSGLLRARETSKLPEDRLCSLPQLWDLSVRQQLLDLPLPAPYLAAVAEQVSEAVTTWQNTLNAPNSLVMLGSPVDDAGLVLTAALAQQDAADDGPEDGQRWRIFRPLDWTVRPAAPLSIKSQLAEALKQLKESEEDDGDDDPDDLSRRFTIIVLPPLEQCFLRCIGGWQGVEWLRDTAGAQRNYFWLISCNTWGWAFLNRVCQVEAYFDQTAALPRLDRDGLYDWLTPFAGTLANATAEESSSLALGNISWSNLLNLAEGSPAVARLLWLRSLRLQKSVLPEQPSPLEPGDALPVPLYQVQPSLPSLPDLEALDYYLVHALMLHGVTSRSQLAQSLGQPESLVHVRGQTLRQAGVLRLSPKGLDVDPVHYPRLAAELDSNNFLTGDDL